MLIMEIDKILESFQSDTPSNWKFHATWRRENKYWLKYSQKISILLLDFMEENNISKNEIQKILNVSADDLKKVLCGKYDYPISTLIKLSKLMNVKFLISGDCLDIIS